MPTIYRAGAGSQPKETPPINPADEDLKSLISELKREYGIIVSFFQSMTMNINTLDKSVDYMEKYKDAERSIIMTVAIMLIRKFDLNQDEFTTLYDGLSDVPMSPELLKILFDKEAG